MKRTLTLITLVAVCCAMMASCKNNKQSEPTPEEIQAQKAALADSVLAEIDAFADEYFVVSDKASLIPNFKLTEEEKMVKPNYLLEPSYAGTLVTKSQKLNALAIYLMDLGIRKAYDMPLKETKEVITKLAIEINYHIDVNDTTYFNMPVSERIKKEYEGCRERGELAYFWQFQNAFIIESAYILAQNPELFFSKITEEQWQTFGKKSNEKNKAMRELAKYDEEMAAVLEMFNQIRVFSSDEEYVRANSSIESAKQFRIANKDKFIAFRNALLQ